jgi:uncharacterized membrane protein
MTIRLINPQRLMPLVAVLAAACSPAADSIDPEGKTFDGIAPDEAVTLIGTEPFWNLAITGEEGVWSTPENQPGTRIAVTRFAGNNGLGFSGTLDGKTLTATLTPGECSDGMSDRVFPYVATIALGEETLRGCGYTDRQPFTGDPAP